MSSSSLTAAVVVEDLHVAFGATWALDGIALETARGTTLGVLGHNGAGKTTLVRVLTTLVRPTAGRVTVDGFDVVADADEAAAVVTQLLSDGVAIDDLDITSPTLDDVFAQLTTQGAHR